MNYKIEGDTLPVVICELEANECMVTESGAMAWMSPNMEMQTTSNGGVGRMFGRMFSGESLFLNRYTCLNGHGIIAFASSFPGSIKAFEVGNGKSYIFQKHAFLAGTQGIQLEAHFKKSFTSGLFGGEGFILQKVTGTGTVFAEFDGHVVEYELEAGQKMIVDSGYLAAMEETCRMEVQTVSGVKNVLFGGEGLFNTVITGPGRIWLQTMPISNMAGAIIPYIPTSK